MLSKSLSLVLVLFPCLVFSQSDIARSIDELIEQKQYQQALDRADSLLKLPKFSEEYYFLYSKKGDAYYYLADIQKSLQSYLLATEDPQIKLLENQKALQGALGNTGFCYNELGIYDKAYDYYQKSFDLAVSLNDSVEVAIGYYNMSTVLLKQGDLDGGAKLLAKAYEIDKLRKDTAALGFDLNAMGYTSLEMKQPDDAINYFKESIFLLQRSSGNYTSLGSRYNNLSKAFLQKKAWDSALYYNQKSIEIHEQFNDEINLAERWINRAMILNQMGLPAQAIPWSNRAKEKVASLEKSDLILRANHTLIESYEKQGKLNSAIDLVETNLSLAKEINSLNQQLIAQNKYAQLLAKSGKPSQAYSALQTANIIRDSLRSSLAERTASELAVKYEVDKIESQNEILKLKNEVATAELEKEQTVNLWLTTLVIIVVLAASGITYILISRSKIKERLMQAEINELRLQIKQLIDFNPEESSFSIEQLNKVLKEPLSDREFEVLQMAMTDKNNSEIAENIFVSTNTVKFHLKNVYQKLGVSNRKEALKFAFQATSS